MNQLDPSALSQIASFLTVDDIDAFKFINRKNVAVLGSGIKSQSLVNRDFSYLFDDHHENSDLEREWSIFEDRNIPSILIQLNFLEDDFPISHVLRFFRHLVGEKNFKQWSSTEADIIINWGSEGRSSMDLIFKELDALSSINLKGMEAENQEQTAQDEGIITEEEIKRVTENNPVIIHGGNDGKLICSGSAFLLHPWFNRPQESQTLYFATARHNLCKQILNNYVIKLSTMYVTEHVQTDVYHQDIGLNNYDKILATPLIKKDVESLMCTSDPDITFFKIHLDGFSNHRMAFEFFSKARYFIPKSVTQLSTINDESYNVGIACVLGKWRDVDFERLENTSPSIEWTESLRQYLNSTNRPGGVVWSFGQSKGFKTIGNIDYICYNCASAPGCSGGACILMNPISNPYPSKEQCISFIGVHRGFSPQHDCNIATPFSIAKDQYKTLIYANIKNDLPRKGRRQIEEFLGEKGSCTVL
ncbi:predicted protein [Naegleria gruberi]|uniref:Predicted protein n=1 Tax=Naegleria gruberi TaxID=5762 RepID=D2W158_NAEGR|nr:uncharacterized protein NAEGRDRAFT_75098 [Naegleria gruberi]EFC37124.1 predicted protein [Naegleria gruberi]|eukprot:XP_002669868.1 predicted protein [Naegleria gruberi strain NEG-M]